MSIHERIAELTAKDKEMQRFTTVPTITAKELTDKYLGEVEHAVEVQRLLFQDLSSFGLINMLEEMTDPKKIDPPSREKGHYIKKNVFGNLWIPETLSPMMLADGSADTTLGIKFTRKNRGNLDNSEIVLMRYSEDNRLIIQGKEVTFNDTIDLYTTDVMSLEIPLAQAFYKPRINTSTIRFLTDPNSSWQI